MEVIIRSNPVNGWMFAFLMVCFALLALMVSIDRKNTLLFMATLFSPRQVNLLIREGVMFTNFLMLIVGFVALIAYALFAVQANSAILKYELIINSEIYNFLIVCGFFLGFYVTKEILIRISGSLFKTFDATKKYLLNSYIIDFNTGLLLLPILLFSTFYAYNIFIYTGLIILISSFVYKLARGLSISTNYTKFSGIYIILYLCTVEFLPVILFIKLAMKYTVIS